MKSVTGWLQPRIRYLQWLPVSKLAVVSISTWLHLLVSKLLHGVLFIQQPTSSQECRCLMISYYSWILRVLPNTKQKKGRSTYIDWVSMLKANSNLIYWRSLMMALWLVVKIGIDSRLFSLMLICFTPQTQMLLDYISLKQDLAYLSLISSKQGLRLIRLLFLPVISLIWDNFYKISVCICLMMLLSWLWLL